MLTIRFDKYLPSERLKPYVRYFAVSENEIEKDYKVFPVTGLVIGFQYRGRLSTIKDGWINKLDTAGVTGITDSYTVFKNSPGIGTVLVYFTETGFAHFTPHPAHELFNVSVSLNEIFNKRGINEVKDKLAAALTDRQRINIVERFLVSQLKDLQKDRVIAEAVKLIYESKGTIRVKELIEKLFISQSPFEKRFRRIVGTTPKKFASIIRFNAVVDDLTGPKSLTEICYENHFFDQAHFIRDFKQFTGDTPDRFKRFL